MSPQGTPQERLVWWEQTLAIEGLNHEAFSASDGEHGEEGFDTGSVEVDPADLGIQVRRHS